MNERREDLRAGIFCAGFAVMTAICCVTYWRDYGLSIRAIPHTSFGEVIIISFLALGTLFFSCIALLLVAAATEEKK